MDTSSSNHCDGCKNLCPAQNDHMDPDTGCLREQRSPFNSEKKFNETQIKESLQKKWKMNRK